jgi:hypothetical protein
MTIPILRTPAHHLPQLDAFVMATLFAMITLKVVCSSHFALTLRTPCWQHTPSQKKRQPH